LANIAENSDHNIDSRFATLWTSLASRLHRAGFIADRDADVAGFRRHVTLLKLSRDRKLQRSEPKLKKIRAALYAASCDQHFGDDSFATVQLLSMNKPGANPSTTYNTGVVVS
jgi:hypothetical protein